MILERIATGNSLEESDNLRNAMSAMEYFIPEVLQEIHKQWDGESLDGIFPLVTRKTGEREVEILGQCILISDQTLVPIYVAMQVHASEDKVNWLECRLGEKGLHGMVRIPYGSPSSNLKRLYSLEEDVNSIEWAYHVTYGKKD